MKRLLICAGLLASVLAPTVYARDASTYPDGPIKVVVGFVPGGPTDLYGRLAARRQHLPSKAPCSNPLE